MVDIADNIKLILEKIIKLKTSQSFLIISDTYARSRSIANMTADIAISMGVQTVLAVAEPRKYIGDEPPPAISAARRLLTLYWTSMKNSIWVTPPPGKKRPRRV